MPKFPVAADAGSSAFLDAAARGEFLIVRDTATGTYHEPQFDMTQDPERYTYVAASGSGTVISFAIVHERTPDGIERRPVGIVELDEGPWWWTEFVGADPEADLVGIRVHVAFAPFEDGSAVPYFQPEEGTER